MEKLNGKLLLREAREKLKGKNALGLTAFHTGITVAAALMVTLLQFGLSRGIGNTAGLSGMGTRAILETVQTVLQYANNLLSPFWSLGFLYAALLWARGQHARKGDLLTGFRRFGPYLRILLTRALLMIVVVIICINICSFLIMMLPTSNLVMEMAEASGGDMNALNQMLNQLTDEDIMMLTASMAPMLILCLVLSTVLLVPLMYWLRLGEYVILDQPEIRGLQAILRSAELMRRRCRQLFLLDLRLWWYYGLKLLCMVLCYGDLLLETAGIVLPIGSEGAYFAAYILYLVATFAVEICFLPRVSTAYALAYERFVQWGPVGGEPQAPQNLPWDEQQ